jgi:DNA-binding transcriptional MerR regulator
MMTRSSAFADVAWSRTPELARFERSQTSPSARTGPLTRLSSRCRAVVMEQQRQSGLSALVPTVGVTVPRRTHEKQRARRATATPERGGGSRRRAPSGDTDAQALTLRESGMSFSAIARALGLDRATEAHKGYIRALGRREGDERNQLIKNEEARLDQLEQRIRERDAGDESKLERRLRGLKKLREAIAR